MSADLPQSAKSLLQGPAFRAFWVGRILAGMSNNMLSVVIAWQLYELTQNPLDLGLVGLIQFLPALLFTLFVGHVADRYRRQHILVLCLIVQSLLLVALLIGTQHHWLNRFWIFSASFVIGTLRSFQMPCQQALPAMLVPAASLPRALALSSSGMQFSIIAGPALGGWLYAAGADVVYGLCLILSALAAYHFASIKTNAPSHTEPASIDTLFAGIRFISKQPIILGAISLDLFAVLFGGATALLPIFAKEILQTGPIGLGLLRSAPAGGALFMSLWLVRYPIRQHAGKILFGNVALYGLATLGFAFSSTLWLSLLMLLLSGAADMVSVVVRQSLVQLETPDDMRGRVSAVNSIFIGASNQLGEFESGLTAAWWGPVGAVAVGGVGTLLVVGIWMRRFPSLLHRQSLTSPSIPSA